ncbi:restriction endonuclease [Kitasatospora sp. NPDC096147]|uniref:restriction endonuclease n=1 Tax=Kitasatospora sp. NPDC096147 TaxID=3364093 RepID=UPI00380854E1
MARRGGSGVLAMIAEAQRQQARRQEEQRRAAAEAQRRFEREQREAQRAAAQGERQALRAYQQGREADAARRTAELDERVAELRGVLAQGLAGPAFVLGDVQGAFRPPAFDPGPLGQPVPMPDQNWYRVPPLTGPQAYDRAAQRHWDEQAAHARARFEYDWHAAQRAEGERQARLAAYRGQYDAWVAENRRLAADRAGQAGRLAADLAAGAPGAVAELFETALHSRADWPAEFPRGCEVAWDAATRQLVVDWELPAFEVVPAVARVRYAKGEDRESEVARSGSERKALYRELLAQCVLRVLAEVFGADERRLLGSVVVNGYVEGADPASGRLEQRYLVAVTVRQEDFRAVSLDRVEPLDCLLDGLRGRLSAKPEKLEQVRTERLAGQVGDYQGPPPGTDGPDLFTMDPLDFEELVAELFRRRGLVTRTTARSGDQGVDVVAEDPDPVTGGLIVIQAKRYRRTVDPTAVRDLDATRVHHGAKKGILVTTAGFGPDSYRWVEGKPLTLVDGPMLLSLLHQHGLPGRLGGTPEDAAGSPAGPVVPPRPAHPPRPAGPAGAGVPGAPAGSEDATQVLPREVLPREAATTVLPAPQAATLTPGQNVPLPTAGLAELAVRFRSAGPEADLTLLLLTEDGTVRTDEDFVFYHQPTAERGAVRLDPKERQGDGLLAESAVVRLPALPTAVHRIAVSVNMDADSTATCAELERAELEVRAADGSRWSFEPPAEPGVSAMLVAELYRHRGAWKLRAVGQGWSDGLAGLARAHGVDVG